MPPLASQSGLQSNEHVFSNLNEARQIVEDWRIDYNTNRPDTSVNGLTPTEFAARRDQGHMPRHWINRAPY
jgi:transposase InsO family protein